MGGHGLGLDHLGHPVSFGHLQDDIPGLSRVPGKMNFAAPIFHPVPEQCHIFPVMFHHVGFGRADLPPPVLPLRVVGHQTLPGLKSPVRGGPHRLAEGTGDRSHGTKSLQIHQNQKCRAGALACSLKQQPGAAVLHRSLRPLFLRTLAPFPDLGSLPFFLEPGLHEHPTFALQDQPLQIFSFLLEFLRRRHFLVFKSQ